MSYLEKEFYYYPANVKITKPLGKITLKEFIRANTSPSDDMRQTFIKIHEASKNGDEELKRKLKENLFYFTPCVRTNGLGRSYSDIESFLGVAVMEFDKVEFASELRDFIFENLKSCICAYISPSGKGVKTIIRLPDGIRTVDEFKAYFYGLGYWFSKFTGFDGTSQSPILPLYLSWDENLKWRDDAEIWTQRGEKIDEFKIYDGIFQEVENVSEIDLDRIYRIIDRTFEKIDREQTAHYSLRNCALLIGGYVGAGYLSYDEACDYMCDKVLESGYCSKNRKGYCDTIRYMVQKGTLAPITLEEND
jgi:hypothetical protein